MNISTLWNNIKENRTQKIDDNLEFARKNINDNVFAITFLISFLVFLFSISFIWTQLEYLDYNVFQCALIMTPLSIISGSIFFCEVLKFILVSIKKLNIQ